MKTKLGIILFITLLLAGSVYVVTNTQSDTVPPTTDNTSNQETVVKDTVLDTQPTEEVQTAKTPVKETAVPTNATVSIKSYSAEPPSLLQKETLFIQNTPGSEYIEVTVEGSVKALRRIELTYEEDALTESDTLNTIGDVKDKVIVIRTTVPEGIPTEKLVWIGASGKQYEFIIQYDGINGTISNEIISS